MSASNRPIRPSRGRSMYDSEQFSRGESKLFAGDQFINEKLASTNLVRPQYKSGPLVFRAWPALDPANPDRLLPGRMNANDLGFSEWMVRVSMVRFAGTTEDGGQPVSYIPYYPWNAQAVKGEDPYRILYFACKAAMKTGKFGGDRNWLGTWNKLLMTDRNQTQAPLGPPSSVWFLQGIVYANGEKDYTAPNDRSNQKLPPGMHEDDRLQVIMLTGSCGESLQKLINIRKTEPGNVNEQAEPWKLFRYGDPVGIYNTKTGGLDGGLVFIVYNPKVTTSITKHTTVSPPTQFQGYEVAVATSYPSSMHPKIGSTRNPTYTAALAADQVDLIKKKWQFWWDESTAEVSAPGLLRVPPMEEQCLLLAKAFKAYPLMLEWAWSENPEFLTADVRQVLNKSVQAVRPGEAGEYEQRPARAARNADVTQQEPAARAARPSAAPAAPAADDFEEDQTAGQAAEAADTEFADAADVDDETAVNVDAEAEAEEAAPADEFGDAADAGTDEPEPEPVADDDHFPDPKAEAAAEKLGKVETLQDDYGFGDTGAGDDFNEEATPEPAAEPAKPAKTDKPKQEARTARQSAPAEKTSDAPATAAVKTEVANPAADSKARMRATLDAARARAASRTSPQPKAAKTK